MASKTRERLLLQEWARLTGAIDPSLARDSERPDFLVAQDAATLGIEVTEFAAKLLQDTPYASAQAALRDRLLANAHRLYSQESDLSLYVGVSFNPEFPLRKDLIPQLARELTDFLLMQQSDVLWADVPQAWDDHPTTLRGIDSVVAVRVDREHAPRWHAENWGLTRTVALEEIGSIVRGKETRLDEYLTRCDKAWLLIAFDRPSAGDLVHPPAKVDLAPIQTGFARVSCFHFITGKVVEIPVA